MFRLQVLEELITLAKDLDAATKRGQYLGLTDDEVAFYDALAANESALIAMGDDKLMVFCVRTFRFVAECGGDPTGRKGHHWLQAHSQDVRF